MISSVSAIELNEWIADDDASRVIWQAPVGDYTTGFFSLVDRFLSAADALDGEITFLEEGYDVLRPIPYVLESLAEGGYEARFEEGQIAISGDTAHDAYQALVAEILDTFDTLVSEPRLAPAARAQLTILRRYIGQA